MEPETVLMAKQRRAAKLMATANFLKREHGDLMARHFTVNPNAGTVSDIRDGTVFAYLSQPYAEMDLTYLTSWAPWNIVERGWVLA